MGLIFSFTMVYHIFDRFCARLNFASNCTSGKNMQTVWVSQHMSISPKSQKYKVWVLLGDDITSINIWCKRSKDNSILTSYLSYVELFQKKTRLSSFRFIVGDLCRTGWCVCLEATLRSTRVASKYCTKHPRSTSNMDHTGSTALWELIVDIKDF